MDIDYKNDWTPELQELRERLKSEIVAFKYMKRDGTLRLAHGTLDPTKAQGLRDYEARRAERVHNEHTVTYWDIDRDAFRTFTMDNFIGIVDDPVEASETTEEPSTEA